MHSCHGGCKICQHRDFEGNKQSMEYILQIQNHANYIHVVILLFPQVLLQDPRNNLGATDRNDKNVADLVGAALPSCDVGVLQKILVLLQEQTVVKELHLDEGYLTMSSIVIPTTL